MSNSGLINWIKNLLFGNAEYNPESACSSVVSDLEKELALKGIVAKEAIRNGGLVLAPYVIARDLDSLLDFLEKSATDEDRDIPKFSSRIVVNFYNHLCVIAGANLENGIVSRKLLPSTDSTLLPPPKNDLETLQKILQNRDPEPSLSYNDAEFWGKIARRLLQYQRPPGPLVQVDSPPIRYLQDIQRLYDVTIKVMGRPVDPFSMRLVERKDYLNPIHWQSDQYLQIFLKMRPEHPFTKSIVALIDRIVDRILQGKADDPVFSICSTKVQETLHILLKNIVVVHNTVRNIYGTDTPPKLVDVFQRLLALLKKDHLWQQLSYDDDDDEDLQEDEKTVLNHLHLYETLLLLEKENNLLFRR